MKREAIVCLVSGAFFGLIVGWILGSQQATVSRVPPPTTDVGSVSEASPPPALDEARVRDLTAAAERDPQDAVSRATLGNLFFDAERYDEAIRWYEATLEVDPRNVNVSTDLGVSYYYSDQPDRALEQFDHSLSVDPTHTKTLLNMGIVRAFGKQDLEGATAAWQRVIELAPDSAEGRAASQALDAMNAAHPDLGDSSAGAPPPE